MDEKAFFGLKLLTLGTAVEMCKTGEKYHNEELVEDCQEIFKAIQGMDPSKMIRSVANAGRRSRKS